MHLPGGSQMHAVNAQCTCQPLVVGLDCIRFVADRAAQV